MAERAALLPRGIAQDHPFADGNKRTAFAVAETFLHGNGHHIEASADEVVAFMLAVARVEFDVDGIRGWIEQHTRKA
jgi:death-on-curing protein